MRIRTMLALLTAVLAAFLACASGQAEAGIMDLEQFAAAVEEHAAQLEETFTIPITKDLMEQLQAPSSAGRGSTILGEITGQAGICGSYRYSWNDTQVTFHGAAYRSGWRILCCQRSGRTDLLSVRERKTLVEAYTLVNRVSGSDLEKERRIYDELCRRISYERQEDPDGEKDTAVGGLLNGRADCDGYADSMLLCCGLAGIPCRYIQGDSLKPSPLAGEEGGHAWNLVQIGGSWLMCDVTWGDSEESGPTYLYFNLGRTDAGESYRWEERTLFTEVAPAADFSAQLMPDQQPAMVVTPEDAYSAVRAAAAERKGRLTLFSPQAVPWKTDSDAFMRMIRAGGVEKCSYHETGRFFEISEMAWPEHPFCFCDSGEEALAAISGYADLGVSSFSLCFHPDIAGSLFSGDLSGLTALLAGSRLENPGSFRYSAESGIVTLEEVSFIDPPAVCTAPEDVDALIRAEMPGNPATVCFLLVEGAEPSAFLDHAANTLAGYGILSIRYSTLGNRVTLYLR